MNGRELRQKIQAIISAVFPISNSSFKQIEDLVELMTVAKDAVFIKKDLPNAYEYFVLEGVCKSFLYDPEGEAITLSYFLENEILSPNTTRVVKGLSNLNFQALTACTFAQIDAAKFEQLMIDHLDVRTFGNATLQRELFKKIDKEISMASMTAKERLVVFRQRYPQLENQISHADIASYLGITNISLSRLRKDLMD